MKHSPVFPEHMLRRMSAKDRKSLGPAGMLAEEAVAKYEAGQERELQKHIAGYLAHVRPKPYVHKAPFTKRAQGKPGRADFVVCYRGRWLSIEAKAGNGKQRPEQITHQREIEAAGGVYVVVRSLPEVQAALRKIDQEEIPH